MLPFKNPFRLSPAVALPAVPTGQRVYAIGDVHGCLPQLECLADAIECDDAARGDAETTVIMLGDLVDRGPDSAGVIAFARAWQGRRKVRILAGNHEEMFLRSFDDINVLREFLRFGGRETVLSYGIESDTYVAAELDELQMLIAELVPQADRDFITGWEDSVAIGDYLFVHAGVRPGVPLDEQRPSDLHWIRGEFLDYPKSFGPIIVHGHTIFAKPEVKANRIGIDTGAYSTGRLTALGLQGDRRWLITAEDDGGTITTAKRSI
ncbi:MAG: metallophosphoesterase [Proteobacteria bacterium]|nr:metallophosphoesterase [Pseudomonadota bacterium]